MSSVLENNTINVSVRPKPGSFYWIQEGDTLLGIAGEAYKVRAGSKERLSFAKEINRHPLNRKYVRHDKTTPLFPEGLISFYPQFACDPETLIKTKGRPSEGKCFAIIWIPSENSDDYPVSHNSAEWYPDESGLEEYESGYGSQATQEKTRWYQAILKYALGNTSVPINGDHNNAATRNAMKSFQQKYDLKRKDGYLGVDTNYALTQIALQSIHNAFIANPFGKSTNVLKEQIKRFQHDFKLAVDGKVGEKTRTTMVDVLAGKIPRPIPLTDVLTEKGITETGSKKNGKLLQNSEIGISSAIGVIGADDRKPEKDTLKKPNQWICQIIVIPRCTKVTPHNKSGEFTSEHCDPLLGKNRSMRATGTLISPRHVLTVAHALSNFEDETQPRDFSQPINFLKSRSDVSVHPARNGAFGLLGRGSVKFPYGKHRGTYRLLDGYEQTSNDGTIIGFDHSYDLALIELSKPVEFLTPFYKIRIKGKRKTIKLDPLGYWGVNDEFQIHAAKQLPKGTGIFSIGYPMKIPMVIPKENKNDMQWKTTGTIVRHEFPRNGHTHPMIYVHNADQTKGQSGGPVWIEQKIGGKVVKVLIGIATQMVLGWEWISINASGTGSFPIHILTAENKALALTEPVLKKIASWESETFEYTSVKQKIEGKVVTFDVLKVKK